MNGILKHPASKPVVHFLILALLLPLAALVRTPVYAQFGGRVARQIHVALIDVDVVGQVPPEAGDVSVAGRDAIWNELHQSRRFVVSQGRDVETAIQALGLEKPYNRNERVALARELQVDGICEGTVRVVGIGGDPRVATVELQVRILDQLIEEYINGATVTESSDPMPGFSGPDQKLVSDALKKAAASAADEMSAYIVPEGMVMSAFNKDAIIINMGERHGIRRDMRFVVMRKVYDRTTGETRLERVCKLRVKEVRLQTCLAAPDGSYPGVLTEDLVRGVWTGPNMEAGATTRTVVDVGPQAAGGGKKHSSSFGKALVILLVVFLIARLVAGRNIYVSPQMSAFAAPLSDITLTDAAIQVRWSAPQGIRTTPEPRGAYVVGYEVYRGTLPGFPLTPSTLQGVVVGGQNTFFTDTAGVSAAVGQEITMDTNDTTGIVNIAITPVTDPEPARTVSETSITYTVAPTPIEPGQSYYYAIQVIMKQFNPVPFGDVGLGGRLRVTQPQQGLGPVTALAPPLLESPADYPNPGSTDVDLNTVQFQWQAAESADTYVIQLSADPNFPQGGTVQSTEFRLRAAAGQILSQRFQGADLSQVFQGVPGLIYWRVGCRNSVDPAEPVDRNGNRVGYVFSQRRAFQQQEQPPAQP